MRFWLLLTLISSLLTTGLVADESPVELIEAQMKYRVSQAKVLKQADRVIIYLVAFDGNVKGGDRHKVTEDSPIFIAPYDRYTNVLSKKELKKKDKKKLLEEFTKRVAAPEFGGLMSCHFPIHGIRLYKGDKIIHEGTFCWHCGNFSFSYPDGAGWLNPSSELKKLFNKLLPIPKEEVERFYAETPVSRPKEEKVKE